MKFPSLTRIHKHKTFHYEPRYYDPVKEDIKNRTERIRAEISAEKDQSYRQHIREAFSRRDRENKKTSFMQLLLITIMMGTFVGWLYYGNVAFYAFLVLFPLYVILRTSKLFRS